LEVAMMDLKRLFDPEVKNDHPRLERLFEMAKQDFWNDTTAVDWSRELVLPVPMRRPLARILSIIYYGERAALEVSAQLISLVDDEQAKFALAAQVIEEAKHVSCFRRVLTKLDEIHPADPWSRRLLGDLVTTRNVAAKLIGMQLIVENLANHLFHHIGRAVPDPLLAQVLEYVGRDEKKHTGLAAIYLPHVLPKLSAWELPVIKAKQLYWSFCLDRTIYNHRHDADALGIDLYDAMIKGLEAQERIVAQIGTRRGIWKNNFLEGLSLEVYKRHRERQSTAGAKVTEAPPLGDLARRTA
jgi:rubrerythrin